MATSAALRHPLSPPTEPAPRAAEPRRAAQRARPLPAQAPAPFLKWAGGKGRLLAQLRPLLPPGVERMRHVEPFVGGGALFFDRAPERALVADVNPALVRTYEAVRDRVEEIIAHLARLSRGHGRETYYRTRERYNHGVADDAEHASLFIYLNKTCFNGLHRVNRSGHFNVPMGRYDNPRILDEDGLRVAGAALERAEIRNEGFEALVETARPGDFVYFDPPYHPVSETASFTSYAAGDFGPADQGRLRDVFRVLDRRGCRLMLSNSDVPFVRELYAGFRIDTVAAPRAISCHGRGRQKVSEVVVRNYG